MGSKSISSRKGSIYLITLITVAAIVSMVLLGVKLRSSTNDQSALIEQMSEANTGVLDAAELAIETIVSDQQWQNTAKSGVVYSELVVGSSSYSAAVVDAIALTNPTTATTSYRVTVASNHDAVRSSAQVDLLGKMVDYQKYVEDLGATHYWRLNESSSSTEALDPVGLAPGGYSDLIAAGAGLNEYGALVPVFSDASDDVQVPWENDFEQKNGTIGFWMKFTHTGSAVYSILGMQYELDGVATVSLTIDGNGRLAAYVNDTGVHDSSKFAFTAKGVTSVNTWHHIVMKWGNIGLSLCVDGVQVAHNASNRDKLNTQNGPNGNQPFHIGGGFANSITMEDPTGFKGSVAHVTFFPKQLNPEDIVQWAAIKPDLMSFTLVEDSWVRVFE